ncbi:MAG TPA: FHA domain-containing protein [Gemmatimonadaceae bacterium]|nr:FHA domain-containing protein [Gemmatimonadaceae bacterium]
MSEPTGAPAAPSGSTPPAAPAHAPRGVLEVLDSHGERIGLARIDALPATIGRAYSSDVVVDDPYMDAVHIRIVEDGAGLAAEDAGSVNGLRVNGANERVTRVPLAMGMTLHAGRTTIRYLDPLAPVPPAKRDRAGAWNAPVTGASRLRSPWVRGGIVALCCALSVVRLLAADFEGKTGATVFAAVFVALAITFAWAGIWSLAAKLFRHPAFFTHHVAIAALAGIVLILGDWLQEWLTFLWPRVPWEEGMGFAFVVVLVLAVYAQLGLASSWRGWARWAAAVIGPVAVCAVILWVSESGTAKFSTKMSFENQVYAWPSASLPAGTVENLIGDVKGMRGKVDE